MREIDHLRKDGHLAAWKELGRRIAAREAVAQMKARQQATVVTVDFTRELSVRDRFHRKTGTR